jgi:DNA-binding protein HU-beta
MTKAEFIDKVYTSAGGELTKKQVAEIVDATFSAMGDAIKGGRFAYPSFGTFTLKERAARTGRNPANGETIQIAASKSIGFKPATSLKASL